MQLSYLPTPQCHLDRKVKKTLLVLVNSTRYSMEDMRLHGRENKLGVNTMLDKESFQSLSNIHSLLMNSALTIEHAYAHLTSALAYISTLKGQHGT